MKSQIVIDIEHHPGVGTPERVKSILDTLLSTEYAVRDFNITVTNGEAD